MVNQYEQKILEMQGQFEQLSQAAISDWQDFEIHQVEEKIFRAVLEMGKKTLEAYIAAKGTGKDTFGKEITAYSEKNWDYISIFGTVKIPRAYFWKKGKGSGVCPIDRELNLPRKHYSYLLQNWNQLLAVDDDFDHAREVLERIFKLSIWSQQSEQINRDASKSVDQFYNENPEEKQKQPILVVEADGKGIIIRKEEKQKKTHGVRLKKGEKNGKKKMATVTAIFGIERNKRTVDDIIKHEIDNSAHNPEAKSGLRIERDDGPKPENKKLRATLKGKVIAFERLIPEIKLRDPENICEKAVLMDGEPALEKKALEYLVPLGFIIILDLFHVMERLWELCYFFCKEGTLESVKWVRKYLTMILTGKTGYFIGAIRQILTKGNYTKSKKNSIEKKLAYFEKRKEYMKYDEYLKKGYPVGSGVIEGACRSFVKDRMELAGMRWTIDGAESMLELRSIKTNGKWDDFWTYYNKTEHEKKYSNHTSYFDVIEDKVA